MLEDFFILVLPIIEIKNLQLGKGKKYNLFLMFSIGSLYVIPLVTVASLANQEHSACVTSIVRLKFLSDFANSFDATWDQTDVVKWSLIEELVAVLCAWIPSLRAFII